MSNKETEQLIIRIKKVFAKVKYPGDTKLVVGYSEEAKDYQKAFKGKNWRDLRSEFVSYNYASVSFFSPEAFRYFLPGLMILCLQDLSEVDMVVDELVSQLTLPEIHDCDLDTEVLKLFAEGDMKLFNELCEIAKSCKPSDKELVESVIDFYSYCGPLDFEQKQVIRDFLGWLCKYGKVYFDGEPEIAIERYWGQL